MNENAQTQLNIELYDKFSDEMESFQNMLGSLPGKIALQYARTYCLMKDALLSLEINALSVSQAQALLAAQTPLKDIVKAYEADSSDHMEKLFSCIASYADSRLASTQPLARLKTRVENNYLLYREKWLQMSPEELIAHYEELEAVTRMAKTLPDAVSETDAEYLLRFRNPLEVVSDEWISRNGTDSLIIDDEMTHLLWSLRDRGCAEDAYELDEEYIASHEES